MIFQGAHGSILPASYLLLAASSISSRLSLKAFSLPQESPLLPKRSQSRPHSTLQGTSVDSSAIKNSTPSIVTRISSRPRFKGIYSSSDPRLQHPGREPQLSSAKRAI